jgi:hypothetical protein
MTREVARDRPREKGGRDAAATIDTKTTGHGSQRRGLVAEPLGDLVEWLSIHEDCAEGFVSAVERLFGLKEKPAGVAPIHDASSRRLIIFRPAPPRSVHQQMGPKEGRSRPLLEPGPGRTVGTARGTPEGPRNGQGEEDADQAALGRENNQRLGSGNGQIPEESDLPCLKRMTIFRAAEIGVEDDPHLPE